MIGVLVPTVPKSRPNFLEFCIKQIARQTIQPDLVVIVDDPKPEHLSKDITWRYKIGLERLRQNGVKVAFLIEDDDWYSPNYIEIMLREYEKAGRPEIFGINQSIYYHILVDKYWVSDHEGRASAMSTLLSVEAMETFQWGRDDDPWFDIAVWKQLKGRTMNMPKQPIAIGIKHGLGIHGGVGHNTGFHHYKPTFRSYLANIVGNDISFYDEVTRTKMP